MEAKTKEWRWINISEIDSIIVIRESFWSSGPRNNVIKYK